MKIRRSPRAGGAFTLIELLVVISIIAILSTIAMVAMKGAFNAAKKAQAKNDMTTIVQAVTSYYTDYGKYPLTQAQATSATDTAAVFGAPSGSYTNDKLMNVLRCPGGWPDPEMQNPRQVKYMQTPDAKDQSFPKAGIAEPSGQFMDPWGVPYVVFIDGDYAGDIDVSSCFTSGLSSNNAPAGKIQIPVGAASIGFKYSNTTPPRPAAHAFDKSYDLLSWQ